MDVRGEEELLRELSQLARMDMVVALDAVASTAVEIMDGSSGEDGEIRMNNWDEDVPGSCEHAFAGAEIDQTRSQ